MYENLPGLFLPYKTVTKNTFKRNLHKPASPPSLFFTPLQEKLQQKHHKSSSHSLTATAEEA